MKIEELCSDGPGSFSPAMEDNIKNMMANFVAMKEAISGVQKSILDVKEFLQNMETRANVMAAAMESAGIESTELIAALIKEKNAERDNFAAAIQKTKDDAKTELEAAVIKAKEDAIKEMDGEIVKNKEDFQKELDSLKQLTILLSQTSQVQNKAPSERMSVTSYLSPSQTSETQLSESAKSFGTICEELLKHTKNYLRNLNVEYRVDISAVSSMIKYHRVLYAFLFETTEFGTSEAQDIIAALGKEGTTIAPTTVLAVKKAFRLLGEGQFLLEYRALARFLTSCDVALRESKAAVGYVGDDALVDLVKTALERQRIATGILHNWEFKADKSGKLPAVNDDMRKAFEKTCPKDCLNGLRTLKPQDYPEMFTTARREVGLCCRCKDCRKGLGIE